MVDYESDNPAVRESLAQVQGEMNLFRGNIETILEILQTQRGHSSVAANVTYATGVTNPTAAVGATVETLMETVLPTTGSRKLVLADVNRLAASYPRGMPQNFAAHFANGGAFFPYPTLTAVAAAENTIFPWGVSTVQTPPIDAANPEDNQGQVPNETPDAENE